MLATALHPTNLLAAIPHIRPVRKKRKIINSVIVHPLNKKRLATEKKSPRQETINREVVTVHVGDSREQVKREVVTSAVGDSHIKDYLTKIRHPNRPHRDDIVLNAHEIVLLHSVVKRLERVRYIVGYGHFCVIGFDYALRIARDFSKVGAFTREELEFMEKIYYRDASLYGFMGEKQINRIDEKINRKDIYKVPYTGNYLFRGESLRKYDLVRRNVGKELILTSGIRGLVKQFYLFLNKANRFQGNLSLASRSLAPPGYSYHATGDFDVGQKGLGGKNFTVRFTSTPVFKQLTRQGYVKYRYERDNMLGVRYEPWHIKI